MGESESPGAPREAEAEEDPARDGDNALREGSRRESEAAGRRSNGGSVTVDFLGRAVRARAGGVAAAQGLAALLSAL